MTVVPFTPNPPIPPRTLFDVLSDMEDRVRAADQLAVALGVMLERSGREGFSEREWNGLCRIAAELQTGTLDAVVEWEQAFGLAKASRT